MDDYDPSDFRLTGGKIAAAWLAAALFTVAMAVALSVSEPAGDAQDRRAFEARQGQARNGARPDVTHLTVWHSSWMPDRNDRNATEPDTLK